MSNTLTSFNPSTDNSFLNSNNSLTSGIAELEPLPNLTSQQPLSLGSGFETQYFNQTLEQTQALSSNAPQDLNSLPESLSNSVNGDALTGLAPNSSIAGNLSSFALGTYLYRGNLRANTFSLNPSYNYIVSGNGNVDFGAGYRDTIDLSSVSYYSTQFNLTRGSLGGVLYNPGNGTRVFDALTLYNGSKIYFEGVDRVRFREGYVNLSVTPNDTYFNSQWNLHMMGVHNAWNITKGSTGVMVGVQDTGLGTNLSGNIHSDLRTTFTYSNNYRDDYSHYGSPQGSSHGTAVQGIIAAASNNGLGITGINWNSDVFNIDVLGGNANDQSLWQATQNMINFANSRGQKLVVNMSLGGGSRDYTFENLVANNRNNALFVIASGNDNQGSLSYPSWLAYYYDNVVAVGASWGTRDYYGNAKTPGTRISYPGWWGSNYGYGLTVMGPSEVYTTKATPSFLTGSNFSYQSNFNGTSAATPNVAGVASLVWSANRNLSAGNIKQILSQTAYDLGASGYDLVYGSGFINADAAVRRALAIGRIGFFSSFNTLSDSSESKFDFNLSLQEGQKLVSGKPKFLQTEVTETGNPPTHQVTVAVRNFSVKAFDIIDSTANPTAQMSQFIPVYSVSEGGLTQITKAAQVTGLESNFSDTLVQELNFSSSLAKDASNLMLAYA